MDTTWSHQLANRFNNLICFSQNTDLIIIGDINFSEANWKKISSQNQYENEILENLIESNMTQFKAAQLDVILGNCNEQIIRIEIDTSLQSSLITNNKADWEAANSSIAKDLFSPFCSNPNELVRQSYIWLWCKIAECFEPAETIKHHGTSTNSTNQTFSNKETKKSNYKSDGELPN